MKKRDDEFNNNMKIIKDVLDVKSITSKTNMHYCIKLNKRIDTDYFKCKKCKMCNYGADYIK